jgi:hypothetical protein
MIFVRRSRVRSLFTRARAIVARKLMSLLLAAVAAFAVVPGDGAQAAPLPANSCFSPPDHCLKLLAGNDPQQYQLCLISQRICEAYKHDWQLTRSVMAPFEQPWEGPPFLDIETLLKMCKGRDEQGCRAKVRLWTSQAVQRGSVVRSLKEAERAEYPVACTKRRSISNARYVRAFVAWADDHPEQQGLEARQGLVEAVAAAWPCRK